MYCLSNYGLTFSFTNYEWHSIFYCLSKSNLASIYRIKLFNHILTTYIKCLPHRHVIIVIIRPWFVHFDEIQIPAHTGHNIILHILAKVSAHHHHASIFRNHIIMIGATTMNFKRGFIAIIG